MGLGVVTMLATSVGTSKRVIDSVDIPSAVSWQMSLLERVIMGPSALGVSGIVTLQGQGVVFIVVASEGLAEGR